MAGPRRRLLLALVLVAATLSVGAAASWLISSCPCPDDDDPSPASDSPVAAGRFCLPISRGAVLALMFALGMLVSYVAIRVYERFADGDDEEEEEAARAKKAGYVAIDGDDAEAGVGGGKN